MSRQESVLGVSAFLFGSVLLVAGCAAPAVSGRPQSWIDAPLHGATMPLGPVEVIAHVAQLGGIEQVEFSVNGQVIANGPPDDPAAALVTSKFYWQAEAAGEYTLRVRGQSPSGGWGEFATAVITIGGRRESPSFPTRTPVASTPTRMARSTRTPIPSSTPTTLAATLTGFSLSTHEVFFGSSSCSPNSATFGAAAAQPAGVGAVVLFHRLRELPSGVLGGWSSGFAMAATGPDHYSLTLSGDQLAGGTSWNQAEVQYQFVLQPNSGEPVRSAVFSDLKLTRCLTIIPFIFVTPTNTPVVIH